jgi:hypothetical protein
MQQHFIFPLVYHYSSIIKGDLFLFLSLFLSLSFTYFSMIYKKRTSLLSARMRKDTSYYGFSEGRKSGQNEIFIDRCIPFSPSCKIETSPSQGTWSHLHMRQRKRVSGIYMASPLSQEQS